jgi:hypothetical protein
MLFRKFKVRGGEIVSSVIIDTDALQDGQFALAQAVLAQLKLRDDPVAVAGAEGDHVLLGLGNLRLNDQVVATLEPEQRETLIRERSEIAAERKRNEFWLQYHDQWHSCLLIRAGNPAPDPMLAACITGSFGNVHAEEFYHNRAAFPPTEVLHERFNTVAASLWAERPALVEFSSWGEGWDEFTECFAAAMLLDDGNA